jgi:hypothetical protein
VLFIKEAGKYSGCPLNFVACTEKVHGRLKAMLTVPLVMILQNRTLLTGCRYIPIRSLVIM